MSLGFYTLMSSRRTQRSAPTPPPPQFSSYGVSAAMYNLDVASQQTATLPSLPLRIPAALAPDPDGVARSSLIARLPANSAAPPPVSDPAQSSPAVIAAQERHVRAAEAHTAAQAAIKAAQARNAAAREDSPASTDERPHAHREVRATSSLGARCGAGTRLARLPPPRRAARPRTIRSASLSRRGCLLRRCSALRGWWRCGCASTAPPSRRPTRRLCLRTSCSGMPPAP